MNWEGDILKKLRKERKLTQAQFYNWEYMTGALEVTVKALDEDENVIKFTFQCFASPAVNSYDRLDNISSIGYHMAELLKCYHAEIIDIKEIK